MSEILEREKKQLRSSASAARATAAGATPGAAQQLAEQVLSAAVIPEQVAVSGYWPMGSELDVRPLLQRLHERGQRLCLPVVVRAGARLMFRLWQPGDELVPAGFGTQVPPDSQPDVIPNVLLVPLLAFDRQGYRLGYGGGFYDRTLAHWREKRKILAIGVAYAGQEMPAVPRGAHDQALDLIVTEEEIVTPQPDESPDGGARGG
ncbi:MAG: 5-formyltetrahydrofolate cyclo-ligase [Rhodovibrionaceae bacterium]